jgi:hypothetical protein
MQRHRQKLSKGRTKNPNLRRRKRKTKRIRLGRGYPIPRKKWYSGTLTEREAKVIERLSESTIMFPEVTTKGSNDVLARVV